VRAQWTACQGNGALRLTTGESRNQCSCVHRVVRSVVRLCVGFRGGNEKTRT
jgi:hypothetical protein